MKFKPGDVVLDTCGCVYTVVKFTTRKLWLHHSDDPPKMNFYLTPSAIKRLKKPKTCGWHKS